MAVHSFLWLSSLPFFPYLQPGHLFFKYWTHLSILSIACSFPPEYKFDGSRNLFMTESPDQHWNRNSENTCWVDRWISIMKRLYHRIIQAFKSIIPNSCYDSLHLLSVYITLVSVHVTVKPQIFRILIPLRVLAHPEDTATSLRCFPIIFYYL